VSSSPAILREEDPELTPECSIRHSPERRHEF
jgi:hypothetical protein